MPKSTTVDLMPLDDVDKLELTDEETAQALRWAKENKMANIKYAEYRKKLSEGPVIKFPTRKEFEAQKLEEAKKRIPDFVLDGHNKTVWDLLVRYFCPEPTDSPELIDARQKGIWLYGNIGCGKTSLMRLFENNPFQGFVVRSCRDVADSYASGGEQDVNVYSDPIPTSFPSQRYGQKYCGVVFDDLGTEDKKKHFGNELNAMAHVLLNRYELPDKYQVNNKPWFGHTHITTNLIMPKVEELYGTRLLSRIIGGFHIIGFDPNSPDRRNKPTDTIPL